jgi:DNA-binding transcriptional LysR family regulator
MSLQKRTSLGWDELRLVLAIGRAGTLSGGARALDVDHSTAFRRLGALEERLGVRLFERARDGYSPTPAGEELVAAAAGFDEAVGELERRLAGADLRPSGTVRITTTDTLIDLLTPMLADFRSSHPAIVLEIVTSNAFFTLTRRDADVAIRPASAPPEGLVQRRIAGVATAPYASPSYLAAHPGLPLASHDWAAPDESLAHLGSARWMQGEIPEERVVFRASSLLGLAAAARAGLGVAPLPCFLGDADAALARVADPIAGMDASLWMLTHPDLRRTARIRAFVDFAARELLRFRKLLEGRSPRPPGLPAIQHSSV